MTVNERNNLGERYKQVWATAYAQTWRDTKKYANGVAEAATEADRAVADLVKLEMGSRGTFG